MDMRYEDMRDMRNPYGSRGGYVVGSRGRGRRRGGRRGDRGMDNAMYDMGYDMRGGDYGDYAGDMARGGGSRGGQGRGRDRDMGDYDYGDMARGRDRAMDGHYPQGQGSTYYPIQAMGTFEGYYGMPQQDYARGGRDYGYDMRGHRDYGMRDYRGRDYGDYDDYGDYGETLSEEELEKWAHKLRGQLDEREKQMFTKDAIVNKAKTMGKQMEGFGEKELEVATLMCYTDYKQTIGPSLDFAVKMAYDWLMDKDASVRGAEKLAIYFDCIVEGQ